MEEIERLRKRVQELHANESELLRMVSQTRKEISDTRKRIELLDSNRADSIARITAKRKIERNAIKQNSVVIAIRNIGGPTTAGPICEELGRMGLKKIHNSMFATKYLAAVKIDPRIIIERINSKNVYSLREWVK